MDPAVSEFHDAILALYGSSSQGKLTRFFYLEAAERIRGSPGKGMPPEYTGDFPPRPKFVPGSPAPLIMWPFSETEQHEAFWPQNGTPRTAVFCSSYVDWFGFEWRNIHVYRAS